MASFEEMAAPVTPDEYKGSLYRISASLGVRTSSWKPGAVVRTILAAMSVTGSAFTTLASNLFKARYVEFASGPWLDFLGYYEYGVPRPVATFASGEVTLTNAGGGIYDYAIGDLTFLKDDDTASYRNTAAVHLGAGTSVTVAVQATEAGSIGSADPAAIDHLETPLSGVSVTNAAALVGVDAMLDPEYKVLMLSKLDSVSPNGPRDAHSYWAKSAVRLDGSAIGVTRVQVSAGSALGLATVAVATASGTITGTAEDPATDLGAVNAAIQQHSAPDGVAVTVVGATALPVTLAYSVYLRNDTGLTNSQISALIATSLASFLASVPIGGHVLTPGGAGKIYVTALEAAIGATEDTAGVRLPVFRVIVTTPASDLSVGTYECPILSGAPTSTVYQVQEPG